MKKKSVLFVCMGNICRSPTAEGVFRHLLVKQGLMDSIATDSAGTHNYHIGKPPDKRAIAAARARGVDISDLRARQVQREDFERFDWILAMDNDNYRILQGQCPPEHQGKVRLMLDFAQRFHVREVPDPYYGGPEGFEYVLDLIEDAAEGLLRTVLEGQPKELSRG